MFEKNEFKKKEEKSSSRERKQSRDNSKLIRKSENKKQNDLKLDHGIVTSTHQLL